MQPVMPGSVARPAGDERAGILGSGSHQVPMQTPIAPKTPLHKVPVYEVRLIQSRRPLRLAETSLDHSDAAARALYALIGATDREHFACLFINTRNSIVGAHIAAVGAQHMIGAIDPRVILRAALAACASAMIVGHNHPSGDPTPSAEDLEATASLIRIARIVGIPVLDHVIVTSNADCYHGMFQRGTLPVAP
jgi:DNA repair protein RadC